MVIDDVETLDMVGEDVAPDVEVPPLETEEKKEELPAEKVAAKGIELDLDLELEIAPETAEEVEPEPPAVEETTDIEDEEVEVEIDLGDVGELDLDFDEEEIAEDVAVAEEELPAGETD